jgi:hypothetical protein
LLGESTLDYVRVIPYLRTGDLELTEIGLTIIQRLTQTREDCYRSARRLCKGKTKGELEESDMKTLLADLDAQRDQHDALAFELRATDGSVIPTESIHVTDTEYLLAIARERDEEDESSPDVRPEDVLDSDDLAALEEQLAEFEEDHPPWLPDAPEREPARFQIAVMLKDEWAIP